MFVSADSHDGFLGIELLRDVGHRGRYVLVTRWRPLRQFETVELRERGT